MMADFTCSPFLPEGKPNHWMHVVAAGTPPLQGVLRNNCNRGFLLHCCCTHVAPQQPNIQASNMPFDPGRERSLTGGLVSL